MTAGMDASPNDLRAVEMSVAEYMANGRVQACGVYVLLKDEAKRAILGISSNLPTERLLDKRSPYPP